MMNQQPFTEAVNNICANDPRYDREAYFFVREALDFTVGPPEKQSPPQSENHVTGQQLLEGIKKYALKEYGPTSLSVLNSWGIKRTNDFGEIVFNLVNAGKLGCNENDKKEDFADGYDFYEAFAKPFEPQNQTDQGTDL